MRRLLVELAGGLPRTFWTIFSALLVNRIGAFGMLFLPTYLITERSVTVTVAGIVAGAYGAGGAIGTLLGGVLADRWGRRATYLAGTICAAGLMVALGFARPVWLIGLLAVLIGLAHMLPGPAMVAAIVDVTPEQDRSRAFNLQFWALNMGGAIAAAVAGVVAEFSFLALFLVDGAMTAVTALIVWRLVPETLPGSAGASRQECGQPQSVVTVRKGLGLNVPLRDRIFLAFVGLTFVLAFLTAQSVSIVQLAMEDDGLRPATYGSVIALSGALIIAGQLFVPKLIGRHRHAGVLAVAFTLIGIGYAVIAVADIGWVYLGAAIIWTIGQMLAAPPNASILAALAPVEMRGRYQGVFNLVFPAAFFVAPVIGGWSLQNLGPWHWLACGLLGVAAGAGHLMAARSREASLATV